MKYKITKTETIYRGKIFNVLRSKIDFNRHHTTPSTKLPPRRRGSPQRGGRASPSAKLRVNWWEMVEHNGAATILPVLPNQRVILVRQYRYPIKKTIWELPAGRIEPGETPLACARREIKEEIGLTARRMTKLISFYSTPGFTSEKIHIFLARGLKPARATPDPDEDIRTGCFTAREIKQLINQKRIVDAKTLIGLTLWLQNLI